MKVTPFYSKNKYKEFSNLYRTSFTYGDITFDSVEMFVMYAKACLFKDESIKTQILETAKTNPYNTSVYKKLGRKVSNFDPKLWDEKAPLYFMIGMLLKFLNDSNARKKLLSTKDAWLCEANPYDTKYGIGLEPTHPLVPYPLKWKGSNLCGQYLMIVRFVLDPSCSYRDYIRDYDNSVIESWIDKLKTIKATYLS